MRSAKIWLVLMLGIGIIFIYNSKLYADDTSEAILKLLIKKGIVTEQEVNEMKAEVAKEEAPAPGTLKERLAKLEKEVPTWVKNTKLKGDLRLRYQWDKQKGSEERHRGRVRYRLGLETKVNDRVKVAAGLASGGTDPRSTNQSFQDTFSTKGINLDYAYMEYGAAPWVTVFGGKVKRKPILWQPSDLLWDSDIRPEGGALCLTKAGENIDLFMNTGLFVLDESSSDTSDPFMYYFQPGLKWSINDSTSLRFALAYYGFDNVKGATLDNSAGTNTLESGVLKYDYNSLNPAVELGIKEPLGGLVNYSAIFGEYINNFDSNDDGFLMGFKFGDKKVKKAGQWQFKYLYRRLETDAWLDTFPDSDAYTGDTNVKGHEAIFDFGLAKNVTLGLDYYYMKRITGTKNPHHVLQVDTKFKF